jgi:hypothetical protein
MRRSYAAIASVLAAVGATTARAQGVMLSGVTYAQYIELRPLAVDSVPFALTDSAWGAYRFTKTGVLARCTVPSAPCTFFRSGGQQNLTAMIQDVDATAWGLGQGVSVHAELRARTAVGNGRDLWPQATQNFDALAAYVELDRDLGRARLGRQWVVSTLGVFNFDGAAVTVRPMRALTAQVYGGNALVEGLNRPLAADALAPVEDLPPPVGAYLIGATVQIRPSPFGALGLQYQRELRHDRDGLYSERVAATAEAQLGWSTWSGRLTRDLGTGQFNDLAASVRAPVGMGVGATLTARRYAPYFDLWTIWGAFSPVAYTEYEGEALWANPSGTVSLGTSGGWRSYDDTFTGVATLPLRNDGWRAGALATARLANTWTVEGDYHVNIGFGASGSDGALAVRWQQSDRVWLGLHGTAFQTIDEFQVGEGRVFGAGIEGAYQLSPLIRVIGDAFLFHHTAHDQPQIVNWNQRRAAVRFEWSLGNQPTWGGAIGPARRDTP